jgi:hypothetical protein
MLFGDLTEFSIFHIESDIDDQGVIQIVSHLTEMKLKKLDLARKLS